MDRDRLIAMGWTHLHGRELEMASKIMKFEMGEESYSKKFGRKTVFLRYTGNCRFYIPFDRDDPERLESRYGFKVSTKECIFLGGEEHVDPVARELVQKFHELSCRNDEGGLSS